MIYHIETQSTREFWDDQDPFNPMIKKDDIPLYADDCPILLCTVASFQALNVALEAKNVAKINDHKQLRPCILVKGKYQRSHSGLKSKKVQFREAALCLPQKG